MSGLWIPRGFQAPMAGARPNSQHSLTHGLRMAFSYEQGDSCIAGSGMRLDASPGGYRAMSPVGEGWATDNVTSGARWQAYLPAALRLPHPLTFTAHVWLFDVPASGNGRIASLDPNDTDGSPYVSAGFERNGNTGTYVATSSGGSYVGVGNYLFPSLPGVAILSLVIANGEAAAYIDGVKGPTNVVTTDPTWQATANLIIGYYPGANRPTNVAVRQMLLHDRALTEAEMRDLAAEPYAYLTR